MVGLWVGVCVGGVLRGAGGKSKFSLPFWGRISGAWPHRIIVFARVALRILWAERD